MRYCQPFAEEFRVWVCPPERRKNGPTRCSTLPDDGNRYEIIDGELLVTPSPAFGHQRVQWELGRLIANYLARYPVGYGFFAPGDVIVDPRNVVEPDIFVVPHDLVQKPSSWKDIKSLLLAVEILSPSPRARIGTESACCISDSRWANIGS